MSRDNGFKILILRLEERIDQIECELKEIGGANILMRRILSLEEMHFMVKEIFTFDESCVFLDFSKSQLYKLVHTNNIPFHKPSGRIFFIRKELVDWVQQSSHNKESKT